MPKRSPDPLNKDEVDGILKMAKKHDDFYYLVLLFLRKSGRRIGEAYKIKVKDIDFKKLTIETVILKRKKKSMRPVKKIMLIDEETAKLLQKHIKKYGLSGDDYVFRLKSYRQIQRMPMIYAKQAGINKNVSLHSFRHYFITQARAEGWNYEDIRRMTGHELLQTIAEYDHSDVLAIEPKVRKFIKGV